MSANQLSPGDSINLPAISSGKFKQAVGFIEHIIENSKTETIQSIEEINVSARIKELLLTLSDGHKIVLTRRKVKDIPDGADGVLSIDEKNDYYWQSHQRVRLFREKVTQEGLAEIANQIEASWTDSFKYITEKQNADGTILKTGLRSPQIAGLYAIGGHWTMSNQSATLVMPTGTGKTETMLAGLVAFQTGKILIVVPSKALRGQTFRKFTTLGLLRFLNVVSPTIVNPIVGIIQSGPKKNEDLDIFEKCNVVVSTMAVLTEPQNVRYHSLIAQKVDTLIVDEAHHIAAKGWSAFKEYFNKKKVLQFTATPFRRDSKLVDGKVIYEYPLHQAQLDGYFKKINFQPIHEIDVMAADEAIAVAAVDQLKKDLETFDHILMARCSDTSRADEIFKIYHKIAPEYNPVIIHSKESGADSSLAKLFNRESRIVVCVNMLGEGFDLPQLKIAAVHDIHKSLAILLQFTGRFTRSAAQAIGEATVIANIARAEVSEALERLYSEDADWNYLLSEMSSRAARAHAELISFLNDSKRLDRVDNSEDSIEISSHLLRPTFNTTVYECENYEPKRFHEGILENMSVEQVWIHDKSRTTYFITKNEFSLAWTKSKAVRDREWHLFVLHHDEKRNLLFFSATDKSATYSKLLEAVGATKALNGEVIFRCLGRINRLIFQNIGVKKHGRRNLRFAMYVGADVVQALTLTEKGGSSKSNLSGTGWEDGKPITIGCSAKGRVWAREPGTIPELINWCENVGDKLVDTTIDPSKIIDNVLIPEEAEKLPEALILSIDWPIELLRRSDEKVVCYDNIRNAPLSMIDIVAAPQKINDTELQFSLNVANADNWVTYTLRIGGDSGYVVERKSGAEIRLKMGKLDLSLSEYLSEYPPLIRFTDLSELDGNLLIKPQNPQTLVLPDESFEIWDWVGVDIKKESIWKENIRRTDSIQGKVAEAFVNGGYQMVFDDDAPGEAADIVAMKEETDHILLSLVHCKFSGGTDAGERVKDAVEVCSQAVRSTKWKWKFKDLCVHLLGREKRLANALRPTRFIVGSTADINKFSQASRFKEVRMQIIIVQPGISERNKSTDQISVLASAHSFLKETVGIDLEIICSA
ncbi:DEAD/DEAH box helicase [Sphingobacterium lactis]|uniref:DEAD/DEAH box helicase n=1 Tax=Sphingobacterium lactis TaxID=797291 RepID=UPI003DA69D4B